MNIQTMNYKNYLNSISKVGEPFDVKKLPHFKINLPAISKYAKSVGKEVPELTDDELNQFIEGGTDKLKEYKDNFLNP